MHLIVIAWIYVVLMMSVAEAISTQGSVLGALITFVFYGVLPPSSCADSAARRARLRPGVPRMYSTIASGITPYNTKVRTAPSTVPCVETASAKDIISTT